VTPIPEDARPGDPRWEVAYLELANGLVMAGARAKLIERYTFLSHRRVSTLYQVLRGMSPPGGPTLQGKASSFTRFNLESSAAWSIQCALFLACYDRMATISAIPLQRGWRLLAAFNTYLTFSETPKPGAASKRLDINQAYTLLTYCGFLSPHSDAEIQRRQCPTCSMNYPILASKSPQSQGCPLCATNANLERLAAQASTAARRLRAPGDE
jgi:hypothetical protein